MADSVDLAGDTHVEKHDGPDEHTQKTNEQEMAHGVRVIIGKGNSWCSSSVCHLACSKQQCVSSLLGRICAGPKKKHIIRLPGGWLRCSSYR